jgi:hypothetical protein
MADDTEVQLISHYTDQAKIYKNALELDEIMVVNFISEVPDGTRPAWLFITEDPDITVIDIHLPSRGSYATITHSTNPDDDEKIHLATLNARFDTAVDDRAQQMSKMMSDKSWDISGINFSTLHIPGPTQAVIVNTLFRFRDYTEIRNLLKSVKEELMEIHTDIPFRLYSKTRGLHISASGSTIDTFSLCSENHEDMEVKCGELS